MTPIDKKIIDNIKMLGINMIDSAQSGHPGIVLSSAPIIYALYSRHLNINPNDPTWLNRDRFVLSAGHGSALLYACLYMAGYNITLDDLKGFRQLKSITPGHPELNVTPGVDLSTGPLGQGFASAVGMAIAEKYLKSNYNVDKKYEIFNHNIYVLCGDGDLMEGISYEASSLAGNLKLDNLIILYDSNNTSLDGKTNMTFSEDICKRFESQNWNYILVKNGEDVDAIDKAIIHAKKSDKPTIIEIKTTIGNGSLLEDSNKVHGIPLSSEDIEQLSKKLDIRNIPFSPSSDAVESFRNMIKSRVGLEYDRWNDMYNEFIDNSDNDIKRDFNILKGDTNIDFNILQKHVSEDLDEALRISNGSILNLLCSNTKLFIGGSADVSSSTKTYLNDQGDFTKDNYKGKNIWFGVREHAMGAILNGISTYNIRTFGSTFLSFSDYLKPAIRMSAIMNLPVTYIFTHDSINIGEDGPTHQPIEQLSMLRNIPNLTVYRPCDAKEIIGCYNVISKSKNPSCIILSRNKVKLQKNSNYKKVECGAYIIKKEKNKLDCVLISSGSDIDNVINIANELESDGYGIRVVSMPSKELLLKQSDEYVNEIFDKGIIKILIESSSDRNIDNRINGDIKFITLNKFGVSGKMNDVLKYMEFDFDSVKRKIEYLIKNNNK
ncbi:MAG: transketolase [Firmicutes bacterium]|nr:transketolase [Bacillota bacterium]